MFHIVLVEPEIPQNTGNVARTCACTNCALHLIKPLGFEISDKYLKRAGLDYWQFVSVSVHESLGELFSKYPSARFFFFTTKARGTGLGLAVVGKAMARHKGKIFIHSQEGKGTCFELYLKIYRKPGDTSYGAGS